jgi:hypothetical protein
MTTTLLCAPVKTLLLSIRKRLLRRAMSAIDRDIDLIRAERINGHMAERELVRERALIASQLRGM